MVNHIFTDGELVDEYFKLEGIHKSLLYELSTSGTLQNPTQFKDAERQIQYCASKMNILIRSLRERGYSQFPASTIKDCTSATLCSS